MLLKKIELIHARVFSQIKNWSLQRIDLVHVGNQHTVNLASEFVLGVLTDWQDHILREFLIDLIFEVIDGYQRTLQMFDVCEHIEGISKRHEEIVHLIQPVSILHNHLEEVAEMSTMPIKESAAGRLPDNFLPVANKLKLAVPIVNLLHLSVRVNSIVDKVETVLDDSSADRVESSLV